MSAVVESAFDTLATEYARSERTAAPLLNRPVEPTPTQNARLTPATRYRQLVPTKHQIRTRAYFKYLERGGVGGNADTDWIEAERELREELTKTDRRPS